jgi:hypothetical protein
MNNKYCGGCIYYTGEECNGPGGSREGSEVYSDTRACDYYEGNDGEALRGKLELGKLQKEREKECKREQEEHEASARNEENYLKTC